MAIMSFYGYIDKVPYYIHNTSENFKKTANDVLKEEVNNKTSLLEREYIKKIIEIQKKREDDILIKLFGTKDIDITEKFEEYGFILSSDLTNKIIKEVDRLKNDNKEINNIKTAFIDSDKLNNIDLNNLQERLDNIWNEYQQTINDVEKNIDNALSIINGGIESDLPSLSISLKKLKEFKKNDKETIQEAQLEELRKVNGKVSNFYKEITEGFRRKSIEMISQDLKEGEYSIIKEADSYRASLANATTLAKADMIIIKKEGEVIIPLGGISVKKTDSTTKFHNTTSITAFLELLKKGKSFIEEKELEHDSNILQYLMGNRLIYTGTAFKAAVVAIQNISTKYGLLFLAGEIAENILQLKTDNAVQLLALDKIFNSEHADFLYSFSSKKGINKITRMSEELEKEYKKNFGFGITFEDSKLGDKVRSDILSSLGEIKKEIYPFDYEKATNNALLIGEMESLFYGKLNKKLDVRITV